MQSIKFKLFFTFFLIFFNSTFSLADSIPIKDGKKYSILSEVNLKKVQEIKNQKIENNSTLVNIKTGKDLNLLVDKIINGRIPYSK